MHIRVKNQGTLQRTGLTVRRAGLLRHVGALVVAAMAVNVSPASVLSRKFLE